MSMHAFNRALGHGNHTCFLYESEGHRRSQVVSWVREGLGATNRVICIEGDPTRDKGSLSLLDSLEQAGIDSEGWCRLGQLVVAATDDVYRSKDALDLDATIAVYRTMIEQAVAEGYRNVWITSEAAPASSALSGLDALVDYETKLENLCRDSQATVLCQYDHRRFDESTLAKMAELHAGRVHSSFLRITRLEGTLRLSGEIDRSNSSLVEGSLAGAALTQEPLSVDLGELTFIDLSGIRALTNAARMRPEAELHLLNPSPFVRKIIHLLGFEGTLRMGLATPGMQAADELAPVSRGGDCGNGSMKR